MVSKYSSPALTKLASVYTLNLALTGGPSVGKTTKAKWLQSVGFTVLPEMASVLIQATKKFLKARGLELSNDPAVVALCREYGLYHPIVDNPAFQLALFTKQLAQEAPCVSRVTPGLNVFDRTYLDGVAYCEHYGVAVPDIAKNVSPPPSQRIDRCYLLESFNRFEDNGIRVEKSEDGVDFAKIIGPRLGGIYGDNGVNVKLVPAFFSDDAAKSIEARQEFMWNDIDELAVAKLAELGIAV